MNKMLALFALVISFLFSSSLMAQQDWSSWVAELKSDIVRQGVDPDLFDQIFVNIQPSRQVLRFDQTQPEKRLTFQKYRSTRGDPYKISLGKKELQRHKVLLERVSSEFNVDPCFIVALWGMESSYGRFLGDFPVIKSLATLAYGSTRRDFFRDELLYALHIVNDGHISLDKFKGEWAGASGQPQFLPSSWYKYAIDYTGNGRKDIWTSIPDTFASIANYLKENGWRKDEPWAVPVQLSQNIDKKLQGIDYKKSVQEWDAVGVRTLSGEALPYSHLPASIITPDGGPSFLVFNNFEVLLSYNNSTYYAGTVGYMADEICARSS